MQLTVDFTETETWKPIPGWEGFYEVSDRGRIRSVPRIVPRSDGTQQRVRGRIMALNPKDTGHLVTMLRKPGSKKCMKAHRAVALAFLGPEPEGMMVCHNDGDPTNNDVSNLRYDTKSANALDSVAHGSHNRSRQTHCVNGHEFTAENTINEVKPNGRPRRSCRICTRKAAMRGYFRRQGKPCPPEYLD